MRTLVLVIIRKIKLMILPSLHREQGQFYNDKLDALIINCFVRNKIN